MPRHQLLPILGIAAAIGCCGLAVAQTSPAPPDTSAPSSEPAQRMSPQAGSSSADDMSGGSSGSSSDTATSHKKKHKKAKTPKPADNDNNATPNSAEPSAPKQSPQ
jgi:hypothetical protein